MAFHEAATPCRRAAAVHDGSTGSRSSPRGRRWATRSTCPPRTATCGTRAEPGRTRHDHAAGRPGGRVPGVRLGHQRRHRRPARRVADIAYSIIHDYATAGGSPPCASIPDPVRSRLAASATREAPRAADEASPGRPGAPAHPPRPARQARAGAPWPTRCSHRRSHGSWPARSYRPGPPPRHSPRPRRRVHRDRWGRRAARRAVPPPRRRRANAPARPAEHIARLSRLGGPRWRVGASPPWRRYCSAGGVGSTGGSVVAAAIPRWNAGAAIRAR